MQSSNASSHSITRLQCPMAMIIFVYAMRGQRGLCRYFKQKHLYCRVGGSCTFSFLLNNIPSNPFCLTLNRLTIRHLRYRQASLLSKLLFLRWRRVRTLLIPLPQQDSRLLLKTVVGFLAIPDCMRQWKLPSDAIFSNGTQSSTSLSLGFYVMCIQP